MLALLLVAVVGFAARSWPDPELRRQFETKAFVRVIEGIGTRTKTTCVAVQGVSGMWIDPDVDVMRPDDTCTKPVRVVPAR